MKNVTLWFRQDLIEIDVETAQGKATYFFPYALLEYLGCCDMHKVEQLRTESHSFCYHVNTENTLMRGTTPDAKGFSVSGMYFLPLDEYEKTRAMSSVRYRVPVSILYDEQPDTGEAAWLASEPWFCNHATGVTPEDALANFYASCEEEYQWLLAHARDLKPVYVAELDYLRDARMIL